jgi:hypothetical protein
VGDCSGREDDCSGRVGDCSAELGPLVSGVCVSVCENMGEEGVVGEREREGEKCGMGGVGEGKDQEVR